jgi:hypothetical protein
MGTIVDPSEIILDLGLSASITDEERGIIQAAITRAEGAVKRYIRYDPTQQSRTEYYPSQNYARSHAGSVWEVSGGTAYQRNVSQESTSELQVRHIPIRSTPTIDLRVDYDGRSGTQAGSFGATSQKVEGTDFWPNYDRDDSSGDQVCSDGIIRSVGLWPTQAGSVKIVYTAGYSDEEMHGQDSIIDASPIMDAVVEEAIRRAKKAFVNMKQTVAGWVAGPMKSEKLGDYSYVLGDGVVDRLFGSTVDLTEETKEKLTEFVNYGYDLGG